GGTDSSRAARSLRVLEAGSRRSYGKASRRHGGFSRRYVGSFHRPRCRASPKLSCLL
ncbi:MAG: hypothetical protein AVDCRST_MAG86-4294, partial [uncultured Truepera sp.]